MVRGDTCGSSLAQSQTVTITATQQQSNFNGGIGSGETASITAAAFNFGNQPKLMNIDSITITLTVFDGDTGWGQTDWSIRLIRRPVMTCSTGTTISM